MIKVTQLIIRLQRQILERESFIQSQDFFSHLLHQL